MRFVLFVILLISVANQGLATNPGNTEAIVYHPTGWIYYGYSFWPETYARSYSVTERRRNQHTTTQGKAEYNFVVDNILGTNRGILIVSKKHGYGQEFGDFLFSGYTQESHRNADYDVLEAENSKYEFSKHTIVDSEHGTWYGIAMQYFKTKENFVDNSTFVIFDDCNGYGVISVSFDGALCGAGFIGDIGFPESAAETDSLWIRMGERQMTLSAAIDDLEMTWLGNQHIKLHPNPYAEFISAGMNGGTLEFRAVPYNTERYVVLGADSPDSPEWVELASITAEESINYYSVSGIGSNHKWVRLIEVEVCGNERIFQTMLSSPPAQEISRYRSPSYEELLDSLNDREVERQRRGTRYYDPTRGDGKVLLAITPSKYASAVNAHFTNYWANWWGYEAYTVTVPSNRYIIRQQIRDYHATAIANGKELLVHLVGDANDHEWWSDPDRWPGPWRNRRNIYLANNYPSVGEPEKDDIPIWFIADGERPPGANTGGTVPWVYTDFPYQDINDDGIADIVVTRWPVNSSYEVMGWASKMQDYNDYGFPVYNNPYFQSHMWLAEAPIEGMGDKERVLSIGQKLNDQIPFNTQVMLEEHFPDPYDRLSQTVGRLNQGINLLVMVAATSNRGYPAKQLHNSGIYPPFSADMLSPSMHIPFIMALSCGTADFARTASVDVPTPVCQVLGSAPSKGMIAMLGATGGTWQNANDVIAPRALQDLLDHSYGWPGLSMAERWLKTQQTLGQEYRNSYGVEMTMRSYVFLGDPCSPLLYPDTPVWVPDVAPQTALDQNFPNPFNPTTSISFTLARDGFVELTIFDVRGRKVSTVTNGELEAGVHRAVWNGTDEDGRSVASGVYFAKLSANGSIQTRKMLLAK